MFKLFTYSLLLPVFLGLSACHGNRQALAQGKDGEKTPQGPSQGIRFGALYVTACAERSKGNLQEALKLFEECAGIEPDNPAVHYEIGTTYKLLGSNGEALVHARICAAADARNEWYQLLLVDCLNATRQYSQALRVREALVRNFPARNEFKEDLAIQYAVMGQYEKSFRIYDELERTYGVSEQLTLNKVKLLKSQKKNSETEAELKKLLQTDPSEPRYYAYLAELYLEENQMEKAKEMYDQILRVDPTNSTVNLALHDYYMKKGDEKLAFSHLKKAFENPDLDAASKASIVGTFYIEAEHKSQQALTEGKELSQIMLAVHPNSTEANALYADFLKLEKKTAEAALYYYRAALNEKKDYRVWDNLLYVDNELSRYDSLERHSSMAMELFPNQPLNYLYNGVANNQIRKYSKAVSSLKTGMDYVVDNKNLTLQFLSAIGDSYFYLRNYQASDQAFEDALKIDSDNTYVLNNYAYYLSLRNEHLDRAEKFSKRSNDLQPNNRNYMDTYGWILFQQGKYAEAETWLSRAAKGSKNNTILEHYGDLLYVLGKKDEAVQMWEASRSAGGNSEALMKKIKEKKIDGH